MPKPLLDALINLFYPQSCPICSRALISDENEHAVCKACAERITANRPPFCPKCGQGAQPPQTRDCPACKGRTFYFDRAWSACSYQDPLKTLIHNFKYNSKLKLRKLFAKLLIQFIDGYHLPIKNYDVFLSVPMHRARLREREINHSQVLTEQLATHYQIPLSLGNCMRIHQHALQSNLTFHQRIENVKGAFQVKHKEEFKDRVSLVIDDVFTSGSTLSEVARALKDSGACRVDVITLARTTNYKTT